MRNCRVGCHFFEVSGYGELPAAKCCGRGSHSSDTSRRNSQSGNGCEAASEFFSALCLQGCAHDVKTDSDRHSKNHRFLRTHTFTPGKMPQRIGIRIHAVKRKIMDPISGIPAAETSCGSSQITQIDPSGTCVIRVIRGSFMSSIM